jgi:hypothetical protein
MNITHITIPKIGLVDYAKGALKYLEAQQLPVTANSQTRLNTCLKCDYYSENTRSADTGKEVCRLCRCKVREKSKYADVDSTEKCPMNFWTV